MAIISTVPGGGFEAQSGTSMAAPHITGLAALLLAHHPVFRHTLAARGPARVAGLFSMMRSMSSPYLFGAGRTGAGLPTLAGVAHLLQPAGDASSDGGGAQQFAPQSAYPGIIPVPVPVAVPAPWPYAHLPLVTPAPWPFAQVGGY